MYLFSEWQHSHRLIIKIPAHINAVAVPAPAADAVAGTAGHSAGAAIALASAATAAADVTDRLLTLDSNQPCLRSHGKRRL